MFGYGFVIIALCCRIFGLRCVYAVMVGFSEVVGVVFCFKDVWVVRCLILLMFCAVGICVTWFGCVWFGLFCNSVVCFFLIFVFFCLGCYCLFELMLFGLLL